MKNLHSLIIFLLCLTVVGFFANFAQNDYGMRIIVFDSLILCFLFLRIGFFQIKRNKTTKILMSLSLFSGLLLLFSLWPVSEISLPFQINIYFLVVIVSAFLLIPALFLPIYQWLIDRKQPEKHITTDYFISIFIALFCLAIYLKFNALVGGGVIMIFSGLIVIPCLISFFKNIFHATKEKDLPLFLTALSYLFIATTMVAFVFKNQHWPGSNLLLFASFITYTIILIVGLFIHFYQKNFHSFWGNKSFTFRTLLLSFSITTLYVILMRNDLAPEVYSNYSPKALQEMVSKANDFTEEGRLYSKKARCYKEQYDEFF